MSLIYVNMFDASTSHPSSLQKLYKLLFEVIFHVWSHLYTDVSITSIHSNTYEQFTHHDYHYYQALAFFQSPLPLLRVPTPNPTTKKGMFCV